MANDTRLVEEFNEAYRQHALESRSLPTELRHYTHVACLKSGERSVFLLRSDTSQKFVLKTQRAACETSLRTEYDRLRGLDHPQIPKAICFFVKDGMEYLLRAYVEGISLYDLVVERGPLPQRQCVMTVLSICDALHHLHRRDQPVIHRDIKPQNIIMAPDGRCFLTDLGTARCYHPGSSKDTVNLGTADIAPPEQFGYHQTDVRSDIYSIGMLMRLLLTGTLEHLNKEAASGYLRRIVAKCTAFDPNSRFQSVASLRRALRLAQHQRAIRRAVIGALCLAFIACAGWLLCATPNPTMQFEHSLLAQAVRLELDLPPDAPIPVNRLNEVTTLILCGQTPMRGRQSHEEVLWIAHDPYQSAPLYGDLKDLSELKALPNLATLALDYQAIEDISPLAGLPLHSLSLVGNRITDLSPLLSCEKLTKLDVAQNPVADCSPLAQLHALAELNLDQTNVRSLDAFAGSFIRELRVWEAPIDDYSVLHTCPQLKVLVAGDMNNDSLSEIFKITSLEKLSLLSKVHFADFTGLAAMQSLRALDISGCTYDALTGLEDLMSLGYLNLTGTQTTDIEFLKHLPVLTEVELRDNSIEDFTPLMECGRLRNVVLEETQRAKAERPLSVAPFVLEIRPQ